MKKRYLCLLLFLICMTGILSAGAAQNVVSLHQSYTLVTPASEGYPDTDGELTDGKYGMPVDNGTNQYYYRDPAYVGFFRDNLDEDGHFVILLDLGEQQTDLADFELGYLNETNVGIYAPQKVAFYIADSEDGEETAVGEVILSEPTEAGQQRAGIAVVTPEEPVSGRFVRCVITPSTIQNESGEEQISSWTFVDELSVLQGRSPLADPESSDSTVDSESSQTPPVGDTDSESTASQTPQAGDRSWLLFAVLAGASALGVIALATKRHS